MTNSELRLSPEMIDTTARYMSDIGDVCTANLLRSAAERLKSKRELEASELESLGGVDAAQRGWDALREHNPMTDGKVAKFADLSHKQKVNYAVFAAGVIGKDQEPRRWDKASDVPDGVRFECAGGGSWTRMGSSNRYQYTFSNRVTIGQEWEELTVDEYAPFVEVVS